MDNFCQCFSIIYSFRLKGENKQVMEYRRRLGEIMCWLTEAENAMQKRSAAELEENFQELTVSGLFVSVFASVFWCMNTHTKNKILHDWRRKWEEALHYVVNVVNFHEEFFFKSWYNFVLAEARFHTQKSGKSCILSIRSNIFRIF